MKLKRPFAIILTLILLLSICPLGSFAAATDAGQEETVATIDLSTPPTGAVQPNDRTTIELTETEDNRKEVIAEIMTEAMALTDEKTELAPDAELLASETAATLRLDFADAGSAVSVQTDEGITQTAQLYYRSETDGVLYRLAPEDEAIETPVEVDEAGRAIIPIRRGASVHIAVIAGYGYEISKCSIQSGSDIAGSGSYEYSFTMTEDITLSVSTTETGVSTPSNESTIDGIQVMERNGIIINDPTITLPEDATSGNSGMQRISGAYWGMIEARYEGGGTHPYPNGNSTGIFTVWYNDKAYTGVCIDPSYGAPGSGYVNQWRDWYYYNVPIKDNPTFFAAIAASYYSNNGSTSGTVDYINLRDRSNWSQVGQYLYSWCAWNNVIDNSSYGHGFAMYHELLGYLANGWSWGRSVLGSSGIKSHIVNTCNKLYDYCNPEGGSFRQDFYNILYTYRVFYYQSTTAGKQRVAWTIPRTDYGTVTVTKTSTKTGEPLAGCTITLTDVNDPNHKFTATTGADGKATFNYVTWTTYTVEEIVPPEGFELSYEAENVAFTAAAAAKTISDRPEAGTLEIVKLDHETGTPLAGAVFQIADSDGNIIAMATTNSKGKITIEEIPYGDYTYRETKAPEGFRLDDTVYTFTIEGGDVVTRTRNNYRIPGSIAILKTDSGGKPLPGVTYELDYSTDGGNTWQAVFARTGKDVTAGGCTSSGLNSGKLITGADGIVRFEGLRADGEILYRLTETATQNGYTLLKGPVYDGTLPLDGEYDISYTVTDGTVFTLPATGAPGFLFLPLAVLSLGLFCLVFRRRKAQ